MDDDVRLVRHEAATKSGTPAALNARVGPDDGRPPSAGAGYRLTERGPGVVARERAAEGEGGDELMEMENDDALAMRRTHQWSPGRCSKVTKTCVHSFVRSRLRTATIASTFGTGVAPS